MNVLLFGATEMAGQGVLRECLLDSGVLLVQTVGRSATGVQHPQLREVVHKDLYNYHAIKATLSGFDACFFCLGVTSSWDGRELRTDDLRNHLGSSGNPEPPQPQHDVHVRFGIWHG